MYLVGSCDELGAWDLSRKAVRVFFLSGAVRGEPTVGGPGGGTVLGHVENVEKTGIGCLNE